MNLKLAKYLIHNKKGGIELILPLHIIQDDFVLFTALQS